ncbi:hypothetical protein [Aneurinibacillus aneurinilyticus]|uniref:Uncharacterized protein n=1 Tax=Aneurinibacillus aneurinilyticus ATCC 12856 TaxID=649747 RepID=U1YG15_ANEAE|nr:hypothetical protein [Aneurinibacillus aneurinilyticus]ERI11027.1 hypothetical protein HMPREF0083_00873 [Aneurinibacillus aneurinilyticus ATCC 12856]MED0708763.1 hypothetical protein [Aneurinibacillus aneurinilyticus]MED0722746.1 hypothetical protein [Aneurinibacillus aneurinilyticus]MED0735323.1 hypothetical protein [Aneurinibacillus aneurinilyticus]MED0739665.1 hypothetical protein [Aneurinibacillus aneurinilyticus]
MIWDVVGGLACLYVALEIIMSIFHWYKNKKYACLIYKTDDAKDFFSVANQLTKDGVPFIIRFSNNMRLSYNKRVDLTDNTLSRHIYVEKKNKNNALYALEKLGK